MPLQGVKMMITPPLLATMVEFSSESHHVATSIDAYVNVMIFRNRFDPAAISYGVSTTLTPLVCNGRARG